MAVIAVAGGTGGVGRTIVEELKAQSKHKIIVLARKVPETNDPSAPVIAVDYSDIDATTKLLEDHNVDTVVCTIRVIDPESSIAQVDLIKAAAKAAPTKRLIASDWGTEHTQISPMYALREAGFSELRKTDLEWTRFVNGFFLDYYAPKTLKSNMSPSTFVVDMKNKVAAIPGSGDDTIALTYTADLAKFVAAFLDTPDWKETTFCYGDRVTFNEIVKMAEVARGAKFTVTHDSIETLKKGQITELPGHADYYPFFPKEHLQGLFALFGIYVIEGNLDVPADKALNNVFTDIHPMKVKDAMDLWVGK